MSEQKLITAGSEKDTPKLLSGPAPKKKRGWLVILILAIVVVVGVVLFRIIESKPKPAPVPPPVQVSTTTARHGDMGIYVEALGAVTPVATVMVPSQVNGQLTMVHFSEGQMVHSGDLLAEIDARPFQAQLDSAEGQLERDEALLAEARMDLTRYQSAYESKAIPKQQLDDQLALVNQDTGTVKFDKGQVENAKVQLGYCRITSSISGRVGLRLVDAGNIVQSTSTNGVVVITQLQPITVVFSVAEDYLPQIQHQLSIGNHMTVQAFDRAQETNLATGSVLAMDNLIDSGTGTVRLKAIFTNEDNSLFPNQFVNAKLLIDTLHDQTLIPASVVQRNGTATFVYVLKTDETVEMRTVKIGASDGDTVAAEGVSPGDVLAADNFNRIQDGSKVKVRMADSGHGESEATPPDSSKAKHHKGGDTKKKKKDQE